MVEIYERVKNVPDDKKIDTPTGTITGGQQDNTNKNVKKDDGKPVQNKPA